MIAHKYSTFDDLLNADHSAESLRAAVKQHGVTTWDNKGQSLQAVDDGKEWQVRKNGAGFYGLELEKGVLGDRNTVGAAVGELLFYENVVSKDVPYLRQTRLHMYGWFADALPEFGAAEPVEPKEKSKKEKQFDAILDALDTLGHEHLSIPKGGKAAAKKLCIKQQTVFSESAFVHVWKAMRKIKPPLVQMADQEKFTP